MTIQELITELEAAKSPSFVLDGHIQSVLLPDREGMMPPNYSASVDAALRLLQIVFPGWGGLFSFGSGENIHHADIWSERRGMQNSEDEDVDPLVGEDACGEHAYPAIALCLAILEAKQAKDVLS